MIKLFRKLALAAVVCAMASSYLGGTRAWSQEATAAAPAAAPAPAPTIEERITILETASKGLSAGDNAWMMTSTALVLFMTLPGLALFYGGLVRRKNVLSVLAQCAGIAGLVTLLWWAIGYTLCFGKAGDTTGPVFGDLSVMFLKGVTGDPGPVLPTISYNVWVMFQLTFAIITPALIVGAIAERMKFSAILVFVALWMFAVYFPLAHMVWGGGYLGGTLGALDFAGGTVVHMSSGYSALVLAIILGPRLGFGKEAMPPHSLVATMTGASILWVGWYGFNAGSAGAANGLAGHAFATTTLAAAIAGLTWALVEWIFKGKPSVLGFSSGIVAGLVVITPATGFVSLNSSVLIGVLAGIVPFFAVVYLKKMLGYDDALDTFGVHGIGGTLGAILTGALADPAVNPLVTPEFQAGWISKQGIAIVVTVVLSVVATTIIAYAIKFTIGLRPTPEAEREGLDTTDHGEEGYIL